MMSKTVPRPRWAWLAPSLAALLLALSVAPTLAAGGVQDPAGMFSAKARDAANSRIQQISRDTGKDVEVVTVANLGGRDPSVEADRVFQQQRLNGVLLFFARDERKLEIKVGASTRQLISTQEEAAIRDQLVASFRKGDFDGGLLAAIDRIGNDLRAGAASGAGRAGAPVAAPAPQRSAGINWFPILLIVGGGALVLWLILRSARRSREQEAMQGYGAGYAPPGGYPAPASSSAPPAGGGWFGGGGGGGFLSGLFGGLAGVFVGNALWDAFRGHRSGWDGGYDSSAYAAPLQQDPGWSNADDAGVVSDSPADSGSWGDAGAGDPGAGDWGSGSDVGSGDWSS